MRYQLSTPPTPQNVIPPTQPFDVPGVVLVDLLVAAGEHVDEGLPEVVAEDHVYDWVEHGVRVGHKLYPELVGAQPIRQLNIRYIIFKHNNNLTCTSKGWKVVI